MPSGASHSARPAIADSTSSTASTRRRSRRSDSRPTGHWLSAPAAMATAMNTAVSSIERPLPVPNTGPSAQKAPLAQPIMNAPATPTGAARMSSIGLNRTRVIGAGCAERVSATGSAAIETSIEASTNGAKPVTG